MADRDPQPFAELKRWTFTTADVFAMQDAGVLTADDRLELIDGELIPMNAKKNLHEIVKRDLAERLILAKARDVVLNVEQTFYLAENLFLEPDILLYPRAIKPEDLRGPEALLVIEISDSTLPRDLQVKAPRYAANGVRDYWVVDVVRRVTHVHRDPGVEGYAAVVEQHADANLVPLLLPDLALAIPWAV